MPKLKVQVTNGQPYGPTLNIKLSLQNTSVIIINYCWSVVAVLILDIIILVSSSLPRFGSFPQTYYLTIKTPLPLISYF